MRRRRGLVLPGELDGHHRVVRCRLLEPTPRGSRRAREGKNRAKNPHIYFVCLSRGSFESKTMAAPPAATAAAVAAAAGRLPADFLAEAA